jgi:hypothetical protein
MAHYLRIILFTVALFAVLGFVQNIETPIESIVVYVLPKDLEFRHQINKEEIKNLKQTIRFTVNKNSKSFNYLTKYKNLLGDSLPDASSSIDVRLLIELNEQSGKVMALAISETELIQINSSKTYHVNDLKRLIKNLRPNIPRNYQW